MKFQLFETVLIIAKIHSLLSHQVPFVIEYSTVLCIQYSTIEARQEKEGSPCGESV